MPSSQSRGAMSRNLLLLRAEGTSARRGAAWVSLGFHKTRACRMDDVLNRLSVGGRDYIVRVLAAEYVISRGPHLCSPSRTLLAVSSAPAVFLEEHHRWSTTSSVYVWSCRRGTPHVWLGSTHPRSQCVGGMLLTQCCHRHDRIGLSHRWSTTSLADRNLLSRRLREAETSELGEVKLDLGEHGQITFANNTNTLRYLIVAQTRSVCRTLHNVFSASAPACCSEVTAAAASASAATTRCLRFAPATWRFAFSTAAPMAETTAAMRSSVDKACHGCIFGNFMSRLVEVSLKLDLPTRARPCMIAKSVFRQRQSVFHW